MNMPLLQKILESLIKSPDLQPITFCNIAVDRACSMMGYHGFHGSSGKALMANQMIDKMRTEWAKISPEKAVELAKDNEIVIAAWKNEQGVHGHVAIVAPMDMAKSPSWGKLVPFVGNVGKTNDFMMASKAFPVEPEYYAQKESM
jgi:hypothetical protein